MTISKICKPRYTHFAVGYKIAQFWSLAVALLNSLDFHRHHFGSV